MPSCAEAVDLITSGSLDLVMVDVKLRDRDCEPAVDLLRRYGMPFFFVTNELDHPVRRDEPWLGKPVSADLLVKAVLDVMGHKDLETTASSPAASWYPCLRTGCCSPIG